MQRLQWGAVLFVVWLGLTNSLQIQEVLAGLLVVSAIVWLTIPKPAGGEHGQPWSLLNLLLYLPVFLKDLVLANIDVASRVLNPRLPINPGIVRIRTGLTAPYQRLMLANSITLTPGTVTLEMEGEDLYVHWIDVRTTDPDAAGETIKGNMERAIARI
ncbi:Na+/H+ antiporter subunit E [Thiocystis violacea]|uniref:Na+/H+ antiporter subunit E n=1 Tax=Thiocystis violacea TaxID=13725 RepID=UPI001905DAF8|nr:Na+/H+ antiporter subunit E [Thiocystis violacea]MBK1717991.1 sodium:proton antiporter [Thiocystis violacea]